MLRDLYKKTQIGIYQIGPFLPIFKTATSIPISSNFVLKSSGSA